MKCPLSAKVSKSQRKQTDCHLCGLANVQACLQAKERTRPPLNVILGLKRSMMQAEFASSFPLPLGACQIQCGTEPVVPQQLVAGCLSRAWADLLATLASFTVASGNDQTPCGVWWGYTP